MSSDPPKLGSPDPINILSDPYHCLSLLINDHQVIHHIVIACVQKKFQKNIFVSKFFVSFYLLWLLTYDVHKFVPVHGIDEDD